MLVLLISTIEVVTISSKGNAVDGGDLMIQGGQFNAASNSIRGIYGVVI